MFSESVKIFAIVLEIAGLFLLAREVLRGLKMEILTKYHGWAKLMNYLYTAEDYEGAYLLTRLNEGDTPEEARKWIRSINNPAMIKQTVDKWWGAEAAELSKNLEEFKKKIEPGVLRLRRWDLYAGTFLLMVAAGLHIAPTEPTIAIDRPIGWIALKSSPSFAIGAARFEEEVAGCPIAAETSRLVRHGCFLPRYALDMCVARGTDH